MLIKYLDIMKYNIYETPNNFVNSCVTALGGIGPFSVRSKVTNFAGVKSNSEASQSMDSSVTPAGLKGSFL